MKLIRCSLTRLDFQLQVVSAYNPVFINPAWLWTISRQHIFGLRHWNYALINHWIYYLNSQHGWILLWLSMTTIMINVFKVALAQWLSYYQWT